MVPKKVLSLIFSHASFLRKSKNIDISLFKNTIGEAFKKSGKSVFSASVPKIAQVTNFEKNIGKGLIPELCFDEKKWTMLEELCSRKGLGIRDIEAIGRYDTNMLEFLFKLPEEKLLGLRDFLRMRIPYFKNSEMRSCVKPETLKSLLEMDEAQKAFVKKFLPMQNRGRRVFLNEQNLIDLAKKGYSEKDLYKLIFDCSLKEKSIMEASKVKDLNVDILSSEIRKIKAQLGKNFVDADILCSYTNPSDFTIAYAIKDTQRAYLKTFNSQGKLIHSEELIGTGIEKAEKTPSTPATRAQERFEEKVEELFTKKKKSKLSAKKLKKGLKADEEATLLFTRVSEKGCLRSSVKGKVKFADASKSMFEKSQFLEEEVTFVGKNGEKIVETIVPSEVEGVHRIIQKLPDGSVKILGDAKIDPKTGMKTITRKMESLNGTLTDKTLKIMPDGSKRLDYVIKDSKGNILMDRKVSHTFSSPNEAISIINGRKYKITYSPDKISVVNSQNGNLTEIDLNEIFMKCKPEEKQKMLSVLRQMSGEDLIYMHSKVRQLGVFPDEFAFLSYAQYGGGDFGKLVTAANPMIATHELFHLIDLGKNVRNVGKLNLAKLVSARREVMDVYKKELELFLEKFPEAQRNHIYYFINYSEKALQETVAEAGGILNTFNDVPLFSIRTEYLERFFPETISAIEKIAYAPNACCGNQFSFLEKTKTTFNLDNFKKKVEKSLGKKQQKRAFVA